MLIAFSAIASIVVLLGAIVYVFPSASNQGYAPDQPIPFSHKLHAGTNKIPCLYCHVGAEKSRNAVIPSMNVCMNCHSVVKLDSPWIQKLREMFQNNTPIEWVRVHELPDHARFVHWRHVQKGISCQTCHGPVQEMDVVYQYAPLNMGWCLDCHRGKTTPSDILRAAYPHVPNARGLQVAPINCVTCHH